MSVSTLHCPECDTTLRPKNPIPHGKKVKCPKCTTIFAADAKLDEEAIAASEPARRPPPIPDDEERSRKRRRPPSDDDWEEDERPKRRRAPVDDDDWDDEDERPKRSRAPVDDDEDERPRRKKRKKAKSRKGLWIGLGIGGGVLLVGVVVLIVILISGGSSGNKFLGEWQSDPHPISKTITRLKFTSDGKFRRGYDSGLMMPYGKFTASGKNATITMSKTTNFRFGGQRITSIDATLISDDELELRYANRVEKFRRKKQ